MESTLDCLQCILDQALRAARQATDDAAVHRRVLDDVSRSIPDMNLGISPAVLCLDLYRWVAEYSGNPDPYAASKREQNAAALALEPELRAMVRESDDPLGAALQLAAAGNIIDLGILKAEEIDIRATVRDALRDGFAVDHTEEFRAALRDCKDLLYLLDNAGEIVFDKVLIEVLQQYTAVTAAVKGAPAINDACMEDAVQVGLAEVCEVIDNGGPFIGNPPDRVPAPFLERMQRADVILGKGQGNYETVDDFPGNVFLVLRAKCPVVARHAGIGLSEAALISTRRRAAES